MDTWVFESALRGGFDLPFALARVTKGNEERRRATVTAFSISLLNNISETFPAPQMAPCAPACRRCGLNSAPKCASRSPLTSLTALWIEKQVQSPVLLKVSTHAVGVPDWTLHSPDGRSPRHARAGRGPRSGLRGALDPALSRPDPIWAVLKHWGT